MSKAKSFEIPKKAVWEAYRKVKENKGAAGVDDKTIEEFEKNLKNNLYKVWNRMSSGSYFPLPVRMVLIDKKDGSKRAIGVATVADRIAQTVVKMFLEPEIEPYFHPDSYGYRPGKSALDAVGKTRERCWRYDWVLDLDIRKFFDTIDRELLWRAIRKHTDCKWVLLYIERWLEAGMQWPDGSLEYQDKGTIQGSVISPLLANLFLHYAFDEWMRTNYPDIPFARYADDVVAHCKTEEEAKRVLEAIRKRLAECGLELHPEKTRIAYCKDDDRRGNYPNISFDFLGYTFRPRRSKNKWGKYFINFTPAVSNEAAKKMRQKIRRWQVQQRSDKSLDDISHMFNPALRGWINYFSKFYKSGIYPTLRHFNNILARWATRKFKKLRRHFKRAKKWLRRISEREPKLFKHWQMGILPEAGQ